ncbi:hypothetical protein [Aquabacterium sp.]|nr:hypothetical protein [Aquabacterium sp.]HSW02994.1 hypothetical protein [Aquabacterium sp.]
MLTHPPHLVVTRPMLALAGAWLVGLREWLALARARRHQARAAK